MFVLCSNYVLDESTYVPGKRDVVDATGCLTLRVCTYLNLATEIRRPGTRGECQTWNVELVLYVLNFSGGVDEITGGM